jgi:hypothetical protein
MTTIAITSLPVVTTGLAGDIFPIVQNGVTSQIANANLFGSVPNLTVLGATVSPTVNGLKLSLGTGNVANNIAIGDASLLGNTVGFQNTAVGDSTLKANTTGDNNTAIGRAALLTNVIGDNHTAIGALALALATGNTNTCVGYISGNSITTGSKNTILGSYSGNQGGLDIRTLSNYVVLSDGDGNPRAYWNGADATFGGLIGTSAAATTIASAATIAPTKSITFISGTAAVVTITAATSFTIGGGSITLIPTGAFTWTTAGNIAVAGTAVVSRALTMTYDSGTSKWYPSYV